MTNSARMVLSLAGLAASAPQAANYFSGPSDIGALFSDLSGLVGHGAPEQYPGLGGYANMLSGFYPPPLQTYMEATSNPFHSKAPGDVRAALSTIGAYPVNNLSPHETAIRNWMAHHPGKDREDAKRALRSTHSWHRSRV
jgi:hypothetical protein